MHHLVGWVAGGDAPPEAERIELESGRATRSPSPATRSQIALGGVRTPLVDVPVAAPTGDPAGGQGIDDLAEGDRDICVLFGTTIPFDQATLVDRYGTFDAYLQQFTDSAAEAVAAGFLLQGDADQLVAEAQQNAPLFGAADGATAGRQPNQSSGGSNRSCSSMRTIVSGVAAATSAASTSRIDSTPTA